jgi:hypothetical protein
MLGYVPYIGSILRDRKKPDDDIYKCRPKRATWIIWMATSWIILLTMKANASAFAIYQAWAYAIGVSATLLLAIFYGTGGWSFWDRGFLGVALIGLILWWSLHSAWYAFAIAMLVDAMGTLPVIRARGQGEDPVAWSLFFLGSAINLGTIVGLEDRSLSLGNPHLADIVYPLFMTVIVAVPAALSWHSYYAARAKTS